MTIPPEERQQHRAAFRQMPFSKKLEHIWMYYRGRILLVLVALGILLSAGCRMLTRQEPYLYLAFLNVTLGSELQDRLTQDFLTGQELDPRRNTVQLYQNLYLSDAPAAASHEYAYTSRMKLIAVLNARQLDLMLMNREAYNLCSANGYLLELSGWVPEAYLTENQVVTEKAPYSEDHPHEAAASAISSNAIHLNRLPGFPELDGAVYLGVAANSPRQDRCGRYIQYLLTQFH